MLSLIRCVLCLIVIGCLGMTASHAQGLTARFKPGMKVIVDFGGKSVGEVVEVLSTNLVRVRTLTLGGTEFTQTIPASRLTLADQNDPVGKRLSGVAQPTGRPASNIGLPPTGIRPIPST